MEPPSSPASDRAGRLTRRIEYVHAASGLLFVLTMLGGWSFMATHGMPDLSSTDRIADAYTEFDDLVVNSVFVMTIGFFFSLWFGGVALHRLRVAEGDGPLTWIAAGGFYTFVAVFMVGIAMGLGNALLHDQGIDPSAVHLMHAVSFLTGVPTGVCGPAFFGAYTLVAFTTGRLPRWLGWVSLACAAGTLTPIAGNWSLSGALNVGNGWIGVHTIVATWLVWATSFSVWRLTEIRRAPA
jgi:hypothetical protein